VTIAPHKRLQVTPYSVRLRSRFRQQLTPGVGRHKGRLVEHEIKRLVQMLATAASQVTVEYFQLPVVDADAMYRERVYCSELYYQLRCLWKAFPFSLGGEVDKARHHHFRGGPYAKAKPDFLVHVPGEMDRNLAAVEVKPATAGIVALRKDLQKLTWFCHHAQYFRGLLLVYGEAGERSKLQEKLRSAADHQVDRAVVMTLYHRSVGQHAVTIPW
jgi:hypothetical protein